LIASQSPYSNVSFAHTPTAATPDVDDALSAMDVIIIFGINAGAARPSSSLIAGGGSSPAPAPRQSAGRAIAIAIPRVSCGAGTPASALGGAVETRPVPNPNPKPNFAAGST
jgi:hypothetical protein